jgi:hypothetical protein
VKSSPVGICDVMIGPIGWAGDGRRGSENAGPWIMPVEDQPQTPTEWEVGPGPGGHHVLWSASGVEADWTAGEVILGQSTAGIPGPSARGGGSGGRSAVSYCGASVGPADR